MSETKDWEGLGIDELLQLRASLCVPRARVQRFQATVEARNLESGERAPGLMAAGPDAVYGNVAREALVWCSDAAAHHELRNAIVGTTDYLDKEFGKPRRGRVKAEREPATKRALLDSFLSGQSSRRAGQVYERPTPEKMRIAWTILAFVLLGRRLWTDAPDPVYYPDDHAQERTRIKIAETIIRYLLGSQPGRESPFLSYEKYGCEAPFTWEEAAGLKYWISYKHRIGRTEDGRYGALVIACGHKELIVRGPGVADTLNAVKEGVCLYLVFPFHRDIPDTEALTSIKEFSCAVVAASRKHANQNGNEVLEQIHLCPVDTTVINNGRWGGEYLCSMHRYVYYRFGDLSSLPAEGDAELLMTRPLDHKSATEGFSWLGGSQEAADFEEWLRLFVWQDDQQMIDLTDWGHVVRRLHFPEDPGRVPPWAEVLFAD